jgi:hypothetical protein
MPCMLIISASLPCHEFFMTKKFIVCVVIFWPLYQLKIVYITRSLLLVLGRLLCCKKPFQVTSKGRESERERGRETGEEGSENGHENCIRNLPAADCDTFPPIYMEYVSGLWRHSYPLLKTRNFRSTFSIFRHIPHSRDYIIRLKRVSLSDRQSHIGFLWGMVTLHSVQ